MTYDIESLGVLQFKFYVLLELGILGLLRSGLMIGDESPLNLVTVPGFEIKIRTGPL